MKINVIIMSPFIPLRRSVNFFQSKNQGVTFDNITAPEVPCTSAPQDSRYSQSPKILCCFFLVYLIRIIGSKYLWVTFEF